VPDADRYPLAVGAAFASRYRETDDSSVVFFGDGAMEEGAFWESINFACLHRLRVLFVCEDNSLAIHAHAADRRGFRSALEAVRAFDCHSASGNGASLSLVIERTREMLARMSVMPRPGFLHFTYHRFLEHVGPNEDYNAGYRNRPPPEELEKLEPLRLFAAGLPSLGCSTTEMAAIEAEVKEQINRSVRNAQAAPFPSADELYTDVLA
jgi:pyruvate dehydrogenase E1 component alpha subunit